MCRGFTFLWDTSIPVVWVMASRPSCLALWICNVVDTFWRLPTEVAWYHYQTTVGLTKLALRRSWRYKKIMSCFTGPHLYNESIFWNSMDTSEAIVCSLKKCLDLLTQPGKPHAAATLASVIGRYCDTIHSGIYASSFATRPPNWTHSFVATTQVDVLTRWQIKSRQGSPLIPLLQELCR